MRGLKLAAIASVSLLLVTVLMVGYLFWTSEVEIVSISAHGVPASNDPAAFEKLKNAVREDTFQGTLFQEPLEWKDASEYVFHNYTIRLSNQCLVPIDMIEAQVIPQTTDILQVGDYAVRSLDLRSEGDFTGQVLAPKDSHTVREILVTYYVWGVSFTLKATCGA